MKQDNEIKLKRGSRNLYYITGLTVLTCSLLLINTKPGEMYRPMFLGPITLLFAIGALLNSIVVILKKSEQNDSKIRKMVIMLGFLPVLLIVVTVVILGLRGSFPAE